MTRQERFFYGNAGYTKAPNETEEQGRTTGAALLAEAESFADQQGWTCEWLPDAGGDKPGEEVCTLRGMRGTVLASLSGIDGATEDYRRVVEAELALEAMSRFAQERIREKAAKPEAKLPAGEKPGYVMMNGSLLLPLLKEIRSMLWNGAAGLEANPDYSRKLYAELNKCIEQLEN